MSKFVEITSKSTLYKAIKESKYKNKINSVKIYSGRFNFPRFTMVQNYLLESLYVTSDLHNPSAYRIYLYLLRNITGFKNKTGIDYSPKKIRKQLNMGNSFYKAISCLEQKNMIYIDNDQNDNKYIRLNVFPDTWKTTKDMDKQIIAQIIDKERNALLGIKAGELQDESDLDKSSINVTSKSKEKSIVDSWTPPDQYSRKVEMDEDFLKELDNM
jgi:hypothetical protein